MSVSTGNGGYIVVGSTRLDIGKWTLTKTSRLVENTNSGTPSTNYEPVVPDNSWSLEIPWNSTNIPDTGAGLVPGAKTTIVFFLGPTGKSESLTTTTVEKVEDVDDNAQDIIRTQVSGKGGTLTAAS